MRPAAIPDAVEIQLILDVLPEPVLIVGLNLHIVLTNSAAVEIYRTNLVGRLVFSEILRQEALQCIGSARFERQSMEERMFLPDNAIDIAILLSVRPVAAPESDDGLMVIALSDVSGVDEAEWMRHDFIANVSHERRSPPTSLSGSIETLKGNSAQDDAARS